MFTIFILWVTFHSFMHLVWIYLFYDIYPEAMRMYFNFLWYLSTGLLLVCVLMSAYDEEVGNPHLLGIGVPLFFIMYYTTACVLQEKTLRKVDAEKQKIKKE